MTGPSGDEREAGQGEVVAFLSDPASHGGAAVDRVDTHISRIFLAGDRAWKLKRAIRTNYLDCTTIDRRERICRRELEVNAAAAGAIYLGVTPVVRRDGRLALGGPGTPVDWLVEMRRFDRSQELDRLCEAGTLTPAILDQLADTVAALHRAAPPTPDFGDDADLRARIAQIADALAAAAGPDLADAAMSWCAAAQEARRALAAPIARRHWLGRIRRCHGDLHLGNVVLLDGRPVPFDAIEFNEAIASIDPLYDLALALADLLARGRGDLANGLLNRYLGATRDYASLPMLPLFLSMRGAVRAMAAAGRGAAGEARRTLAFAAACLQPRPAPRLVAIGGLSGSGKSTVARGLAPGLAPLAGAILLRSDVLRKRLAGVAPETGLPASGYTAAMDRRVLVRMLFDARVALRAGASVVLDATFLGPESRTCAAALAAAEGLRFDGVWLQLPPGEAMRRVDRRQGDASDATASVVGRQSARAATPEGWTTVPADGPAPAVLETVRGSLAGSR